MVMTIGELHAGHCIDPSLADAVREGDEIRCAEHPCTGDRQVWTRPTRVDNTAHTC
jgi:hypothetical protein